MVADVTKCYKKAVYALNSVCGRRTLRVRDGKRKTGLLETSVPLPVAIIKLSI